MATFEHVSSSNSIDAVAKLAQSIWLEHYTPIVGQLQVEYMLNSRQSPAVIQRQIERQSVIYYLIVEAKEPVGYFAVQHQADSLFLSKIYVEKLFRRRGFARQAIKYVERMAKMTGCKNLSLTVHKRNTASIKAYKKMGFKIVEELVQDIGEGFFLDDYRMKKKI